MNTVTSYTIPLADLRAIEARLSALLPCLRHKNIFLTGAKGFFGTWLTETLLYLHEQHDLHMQLYVLTRSAQAYFDTYPHLRQHEALHVIEGSVCDFIDDDVTSLDYIIHAANLPASTNAAWVEEHIGYAITGTQRVLDVAERHGVRSLLFTSSGAVYNDPFTHLSPPYAEEQLEVDCSYKAIYSSAKRLAEALCTGFAARTGIAVTLARCFAFSGACLPLEQLAMGQFLQQALRKEQITVQGDGSAVRSYMDGQDLCVWLISMLLKAEGVHVYNVGSSQSYSIAEIASMIGDEYQLPVKILGKVSTGNAPHCYTLDEQLATNGLGVRCEVSLIDSIRKMYQWNMNKTKTQ